MDKPEFCTDEMLDFLDGLRESGVTNMYGAAPCLQRAYFNLGMANARKVLQYWMETFPREKEQK